MTPRLASVLQFSDDAGFSWTSVFVRRIETQAPGALRLLPGWSAWMVPRPDAEESRPELEALLDELRSKRPTREWRVMDLQWALVPTYPDEAEGSPLTFASLADAFSTLHYLRGLRAPDLPIVLSINHMRFAHLTES